MDEERYGITPSNSHDGSEPIRAPHMQALEIPPDVRDDLRWLHAVVEAGHAREFNAVAFAASDAEDTIMRTVIQMMRLPLGEWGYDFDRECLVLCSGPALRNLDDLDL